jgi:hypothetical protein
LKHLIQNGQRDFKGVTLNTCDLSGFDLTGLDFSFASMTNVNLDNCILTTTQFYSAKLKSVTYNQTIYQHMPAHLLVEINIKQKPMAIINTLLTKYVRTNFLQSIFQPTPHVKAIKAIIAKEFKTVVEVADAIQRNPCIVLGKDEPLSSIVEHALFLTEQNANKTPTPPCGGSARRAMGGLGES